MDPIGFIDIIILIGICQGLFLSLTLQRITNNNSKANSILSLLLVVATCILIGRFLFFRFLTKAVFEYSLFGDSLLFLVGPLLYIYIRRLLFNNTNYKLKVLHYIPFLAIIVLSTYYSIRYTPETYYDLYLAGKLTTMFNLVIIAGIVSCMYYLIASFSLVSQFKNKERHAFSFRQNPLNYIYFFLSSISVAVFFWLVGFINSTVFEINIPFTGYEVVWVAIPVFIYVIGYYSLKQPALFRLPFQKSAKEQKERLSSEDAQLLSKRLDSLMENERIFLRGNLTLKEVAHLLQTTTNNLSWLLNNVYKTTFYDFVNGYRVREFVTKIENKEHLQHTILALSMDVGFNSKSTFNKAFKSVMHDTPSNFIKKYRAA